MSIRERVVLLAGGVGGAKLAVGLAAILPPSALTIVVNTGDDFTHWGLYVSPDLDTVTYNLAGIANPQTGWGLAGDTFEALAMMARYGEPDWFRLGDKDLATSLRRTSLLLAGRSLTEITAALAGRLGVQHPILPMSDGQVRTVLETDQGEMAFQEYFVKAHWQPVVRRVRYDGLGRSAASKSVVAALEAASLFVFGPSNPYLSIDPILSLPGVRERIAGSSVPVIAISPIIRGRAVKGPAAKLMAEVGQEISAFGIAKHYEDILKGFILDRVDEPLCSSIEALNIRAAARDIIMETPDSKARLAREVLEWTEETFS